MTVSMRVSFHGRGPQAASLPSRSGFHIPCRPMKTSTKAVGSAEMWASTSRAPPRVECQGTAVEDHQCASAATQAQFDASSEGFRPSPGSRTQWAAAPRSAESGRLRPQAGRGEAVSATGARWLGRCRGRVPGIPRAGDRPPPKLAGGRRAASRRWLIAHATRRSSNSPASVAMRSASTAGSRSLSSASSFAVASAIPAFVTMACGTGSSGDGVGVGAKGMREGGPRHRPPSTCRSKRCLASGMLRTSAKRLGTTWRNASRA